MAQRSTSEFRLIPLSPGERRGNRRRPDCPSFESKVRRDVGTFDQRHIFNQEPDHSLPFTVGGRRTLPHVVRSQKPGGRSWLPPRQPTAGDRPGADSRVRFALPSEFRALRSTPIPMSPPRTSSPGPPAYRWGDLCFSGCFVLDFREGREISRWWAGEIGNADQAVFALNPKGTSLAVPEGTSLRLYWIPPH